MLRTTSRVLAFACAAASVGPVLAVIGYVCFLTVQAVWELRPSNTQVGESLLFGLFIGCLAISIGAIFAFPVCKRSSEFARREMRRAMRRFDRPTQDSQAATISLSAVFALAGSIVLWSSWAVAPSWAPWAGAVCLTVIVAILFELRAVHAGAIVCVTFGLCIGLALHTTSSSPSANDDIAVGSAPMGIFAALKFLLAHPDANRRNGVFQFLLYSATWGVATALGTAVAAAFCWLVCLPMFELARWIWDLGPGFDSVWWKIALFVFAFVFCAGIACILLVRMHDKFWSFMINQAACTLRQFKAPQGTSVHVPIVYCTVVLGLLVGVLASTYQVSVTDWLPWGAIVLLIVLAARSIDRRKPRAGPLVCIILGLSCALALREITTTQLQDHLAYGFLPLLLYLEVRPTSPRKRSVSDSGSSPFPLRFNTPPLHPPTRRAA